MSLPNHPYDFWKFIDSLSTLECSGCDAKIVSALGPDRVAEVAQNEGWTTTQEKVYCPKCFSKLSPK